MSFNSSFKIFRCSSKTICFHGYHFQKLDPSGQDYFELLSYRNRIGSRLDGTPEMDNYPRIKYIFLGKLTDTFSEIPYLPVRSSISGHTGAV